MQLDALDVTEVNDESQFASRVSEEKSDTYNTHEVNAKQYFESNDGVVINLEDVLLCVSDFSHELSHPPDECTFKDFLQEISFNNDGQGSFCESEKAAKEYATNHLEEFELLARIIWCRIADVFQDYLTENLAEVHITSKKFTCATAKVNELFITSEYRSDVITAFNVDKWSNINSGQRSLSAQLVFYLYQLLLGEVNKRIQKQEEQAPIFFKVQDMGAERRGKIRYIGGWAIPKSLKKSRRYVMENKTSDSTDVLRCVSREIKKVNLLENNVIVPFSLLQGTIFEPETLNVVEARQFRERWLLHISDAAFAFFLSLEQERVDKIKSDLTLCLVD